MKDKVFSDKLRSLVIPIAFQQFMTALVSASDAFMLGIRDQNALSAVSLAGQIMFVLSLFLNGITAGASIFAAQYWGKGDRESVEKILGIALVASSSVSAVFSVFALVSPGLLMKIFTSEARLIGLGAEYLRIVGISYLMLGISQICLCILKNCGNASESALISAVSMGLNIVLNAIFIYIFGMNVAGAAIATVISKATELLWSVVFLQSRRTVRIRLGNLYRMNKILLHDFRKYTLPVLGNQLGWGCGFAMYAVIMGHLNGDAVAANSVANIVKNLAICVCTGIANGGAIMVGNELGRGDTETAKRYGSKLCRIAALAGAATGLVIICLIPFLRMSIKLTDRASGYLTVMLFICSYYVIGKSLNMTTIGGIFCAGGDSRFGLVCDTVTMWGVTVPLGLISAFVLHLPVLAVYAIINTDEIIKLPVVYAHYKKFRWLKVLTRDSGELQTQRSGD